MRRREPSKKPPNAASVEGFKMGRFEDRLAAIGSGLAAAVADLSDQDRADMVAQLAEERQRIEAHAAEYAMLLKIADKLLEAL